MQLTINAPSIRVCTKSVDFRKSINGLVDVVLSEYHLNPHTDIFIFFNKSRDKIKILAWHKNGFILLLKRLEQGCFFNIKEETSSVNVTPQQLSWLLAGLDWISMSAWGELEYRDFN
jgi:transposase